MKYLILSLMVFTSFQAFSKDCNKKNYKDFIFDEEETDKLTDDIVNTGTGCDLKWADLNGADLRGALRNAILTRVTLNSLTELYGADLRWASLTELYGADLRWASFPKKYENLLTEEQQKQVIFVN